MMTIIQAKSENDLTLGRQGENLARQVVFDLSAWEAEYGPGTVELIHQRPGDTSPYPVAAVREGGTLVWTLTATDTAVASSYGSDGHCELRYYVGEVLVKSRTWMTKVIRAMSTPSETAPPEPEQGWVDQVVAVGAAAQASADAAKADADRATALAAEVSKKAAQTAKDASDAAKAKEATQTAQRLAEEAQSAAEAARTAAAAAQSATEKAATDAAGAKQDAETAQKAAQDAAAAAAKALADIRALYQEMQTWAQGVIQGVNDAGSVAVRSVQSAGDTQVQRVTDEGTTQTANAKAQANAAAQSASGAAQSAQQAAESAAVYGEVVADVTQLKQDLMSYIYGVNKTFEVNESGTNVFYALLLKNVKYTFKNGTNKECTLNYRLSDGTSENITNMKPPVSGAIRVGQTVTFTPLKDAYVALAGWFAGTGTVTLTNEFADLEATSNAYPNAVSFVQNGEIFFSDGLVPNTYITPKGEEAYYNGWTSSGFIPLGDTYSEVTIISPTSNGGAYDSFYDAEKVPIAPRFSLKAGVNRITVPSGAKYLRISNTTSAIQNTVIKNIIGYLVDTVESLKPDTGTPSIASMNVDESMVTNAGANYGFHSSGQSNVKKRFSMLVTTDPHGDVTAMKRAVDYLNDMPCFDCGACLGDLQGNTFSDNDGTWYTDTIKESNKPWLTLVGNHDVGIGKNIASTGNQEQVYNKFIAPNLQYADVTPDGKSYYYKDFATYKIRLICLNPYDVDNNDILGSEYVVPRYTEYYSKAQIDWLVDLLANTPTDYHVMVLTHNTPKASIKDTSVSFNNKTYSFSLESSQQGIVADIIDAWQKGATLSHTYTCANANLSSVTVSADFSSRGAGVFICFLTGHMHVDAIGHITSFPDQNVFTFASTNTGTYQNEWSDLPRADKTKAEDCITALAVDTENREIYINRIGSSVSRYFTVRKPSVIGY